MSTVQITLFLSGIRFPIVQSFVQPFAFLEHSILGAYRYSNIRLIFSFSSFIFPPRLSLIDGINFTVVLVIQSIIYCISQCSCLVSLFYCIQLSTQIIIIFVIIIMNTLFIITSKSSVRVSKNQVTKKIFQTPKLNFNHIAYLKGYSEPCQISKKEFFT